MYACYYLQMDNLEILKTASKLKNSGDYSAAETLLKNLIDSQPHFAPAYNSLGSIYFAQGEWQQAANAYRAAIEHQADYADAYYNYGLSLNRMQKDKEATTVFKALLELSPHHLGATYQLALLAMKQLKYEQAIRDFLSILKGNPTHLESLINIASCYLKLNQLQSSKEYYLKALDLDPNDEQVLFNLGVIHMYQGLTKQAIDYYSRALNVNPEFFDAYNNLAVAHLALNERQQALRHFQHALRLQPTNVALQHTVSVLSGNSAATNSPAEYIKSLFDDYAPRYDSHVNDVLHYQVPALFKSILSSALQKKNQLDILDLGCGTGLCGEIVKQRAASLIGVDLSKNMLELARQKHCYTELIESDILLYLKNCQQHFDLVIAGDVLVYIGELQNLLQSISQILKPTGLFIFNVEVDERKPYQIKSSARFAHAKEYLTSVLKEANFVILDEQAVSLRKQEDEDVKGLVYLLKLA